VGSEIRRVIRVVRCNMDGFNVSIRCCEFAILYTEYAIGELYIYLPNDSAVGSTVHHDHSARLSHHSLYGLVLRRRFGPVRRLPSFRLCHFWVQM
jgi:hypothetical protein